MTNKLVKTIIFFLHCECFHKQFSIRNSNLTILFYQTPLPDYKVYHNILYSPTRTLNVYHAQLMF